jgi:LPXTG-site transpeptidase (sortase) family protein
MASRSAKQALGLSLAVVMALVVVTTVRRQAGGTPARPGHPAAGAPAVTAPPQRAADAQQPTVRTSVPALGRSPVSAGRRLHPGVTGTVRPATPTRVTVYSPQGERILSAPVDPLRASRNPDGSWAPIDPPSLAGAVWMSQSAAPAVPSKGTTAIYGHACIGFRCAFNNASRAPLGSTVTIETGRSEVRYRIRAITQYPKTGAGSLTSRPNVANELILVTCAYRRDHSSVNNLVLVADLIGARGH